VHVHVRLGVLFVYVPGQGSSNVFAYTGFSPVEPNDLGKLIRKKKEKNAATVIGVDKNTIVERTHPRALHICGK
jgi:hypothetical protein